jgi:predicted DNA-binding transcriptional regulator AlpA
MTKAELLEDLQRRKAEAAQVGASAPIAQILDLVIAQLDRLDGVDGSPRLVRVQTAAVTLGLSPATIRRMCQGGRFPGAMKTSGDRGDWRIPAGEVYAALRVPGPIRARGRRTPRLLQEIP